MNNQSPARDPRPTRKARASTLVAVCVVCFGVAGCQKKVAHAAPPVINPPTVPEVIPADTKPVPPPIVPPPATTSEPPTLVVPPAKVEPPKPRPATQEPSAPKPDAPQIAPQLTPAEQAAAEKQARKDIDTAENNLQLAYGKQLNAGQHDLVEKIRGFLGQSREALRAEDWTRAQNLAQKARVLSIELVNSF
jgi:hypothetical protein